MVVGVMIDEGKVQVFIQFFQEIVVDFQMDLGMFELKVDGIVYFFVVLCWVYNDIQCVVLFGEGNLELCFVLEVVIVFYVDQVGDGYVWCMLKESFLGVGIFFIVFCVVGGLVGEVLFNC